jgi:parallel beta-helix repeat protein/predicted outer membrane repeat protein
MRSKVNRLRLLQCAVFILAAVSTAATGRVIYVDENAPVTGDGSSWADAFSCLQQAFAGAGVGDEIRVADGIYRPDRQLTKAGRIGARIIASGVRIETFQLLSGVTIKGGYAGVGAADPNARDIKLHETILSGDLSANDVDSPDGSPNEDSRAENSYHVVTGSGADETAVLDGFTIVGGNANIFANRNGGGLLNEYGSPQVINCTFTQNSAQYYGGGIYNYFGSPAVASCTFTQNWAGTEGGGIYNYQGNLNLDNCTFEDNSAHRGGGIHSGHARLSLTDCTFTANMAQTGGGIHSYAATEASADETDEDVRKTPVLVNCIFTTNSAEDRGGALYCSDSEPSLNNCRFSENSAGYGGGGICVNNTEPNLIGCSINDNSAYYGGGMYNDSSNLTLTRCTLIANLGYDYGGGIYNIGGSHLSLDNCLITANRTNSYGGGIYNNYSDLTLANCTFAGNTARDGSAVAFNSLGQVGQSTAWLVNCILWDQANIIWINDYSKIAISYSDVRGGWPGTGNIDADPLFTDPNGPDETPGTDDDNLRIAPSSPCVDAGDPNYAFVPAQKDVYGNPRLASGRVDMGAYEFEGVIYVDSQGLDDPGHDRAQEDGSATRPFSSIQDAIDVAKDGQTVLVRPGVYLNIDFMGKAITVAGTDGAAMIDSVGSGRAGRVERDEVMFHTGEGPDSVLKNFIIRGGRTAISLNYGSSPTIRNLTIAENDFGISAYENSNPDISNCIFWNNTRGDLFQCQARYSCFENETPGEGNITGNPLFADPDNGDYHLMSEGWRWSTYEESWTWDLVTSPCIDAGDPTTPLGNEPVSVSHGPNSDFGINLHINMGAYGGTWQASIALPYSFPDYESDPPEPNPAQWARDGRPREEVVLGSNRLTEHWIKMIAAEATDASGVVEYFFECTTDAGLSSGWQRERNYEILVDSPGRGHRFRLKARDRFGNETEWSEELAAD